MLIIIFESFLYQHLGLEFSVTYDIESRELVEIFVAYCVNNIKFGEPTLSTLDDFERKELQKRTNSSKSTAFRPQRNPIDIAEYGGDSDGDDDNDVMSSYIDTTPKVFTAIAYPFFYLQKVHLFE